MSHAILFACALHRDDSCRWHAGQCLPLLHKDHCLTMRIQPVTAICCHEKAARVKIWRLSLPIKVCELYLQVMYTCPQLYYLSPARCKIPGLVHA